MPDRFIRVWFWVAVVLCAGEQAGAREKLLMDFGWKFHLADRSLPGESGVAVGGWKYKVVEGAPGEGPPAAVDGTWKDAPTGLDTFNGRQGFTWYVTTLPAVGKSASGQVVTFEGVDDNATVFLNGKKLLKHEGWAESFDVPLDRGWVAGGANVQAVLVENTFGIGGMKGVTLRADTGAVAANGFDDSGWREVGVPHDFVVERPVRPDAGDANYGFHPTGVAWYRRHLTVPEGKKGERVWLEFDGVYRDAKVYLNGKQVAHHPSGYTSFYVDVTDSVKLGEDNVVAVRVDANGHEGWWYEGGGIYRHTWLTTVSPVHVGQWGMRVSAEVEGALPADAADATVRVLASVVNEGSEAAGHELVSRVIDAEGKVVAEGKTNGSLEGGKTAEEGYRIKLQGAKLWSPERPYLYRVETTILREGREVDRVVTPLGVRQIRFDADHGFFLNGRPYKIKGTCNHQDFAGVGIALPDRLQEFKIEKLKEMGANAYRCAHHQPAEELLEACDRLGMLVMDENRHLGDSERTLDEARTLVMRDRNHPSVFLWSICNEEALQGSAEGAKKARAIKEIFNQYDGTRPVTAAMQAGWGGEGISTVIDVQGFNYFPEQYDPYHKEHPKQPLMGSETGSILTTRGEYKQDDMRGYMSSMSEGAERAWRPIAEREFMAGAFVWTGFDYRGEPTPFGWPNVNSHFGIMDTCGFPKDDYYYYRSAWTEVPTVHLFPHWNWAYPKRENPAERSQVEVRCYSNCEKVELFVNGESQGVKEGNRTGQLSWKVRWYPGEISARGWKDGKSVVTVVKTAGPPARVELTADRPAVRGTGEDVVLVAARVVDGEGRAVVTREVLVTFAVVTGDGRVVGTGNGDPSDSTPDVAPTRLTFHGRAMGVVRVGTGSGPMRVVVRSPGLPEGSVTVDVSAAEQRGRVAIGR